VHSSAARRLGPLTMAITQSCPAIGRMEGKVKAPAQGGTIAGTFGHPPQWGVFGGWRSRKPPHRQRFEWSVRVPQGGPRSVGGWTYCADGLGLDSPMYALEVYFPKDRVPSHVEHMTAAAGLLARIPILLREHDGCEKIVVVAGETRLFAVDCKGNTLPR